MSYLITASGKKFSFLDPQPEDINIIDIAHHLSNLCRYNGACKPFYSVGQHSNFVAYLLPSPLCYEGLMHDVGEAYYGDITTGLKMAFEQTLGEGWDLILKRIDMVIAEKFTFTVPKLEPVTQADMVALATEKRDLKIGVGVDFICDLPDPASERIVVCGSEIVMRQFLYNYNRWRPSNGE